MNAFRLTLLAVADLAEIVDYVIAESGVEHAHALLSDIVSAFQRLADMPGIGHVRHNLAEEEARFWVVHRYLIAYVTLESRIEVVRVLHGAREPELIGKKIQQQRR